MVDDPKTRTASHTLYFFGGFICVLLAVAAYAFYTNLVFFQDSSLYADRAKHLVYHHNLNLSFSPVSYSIYPPLYPLIIAPAYLWTQPDMIFFTIRMIHICLFSSIYFPLYLMSKQFAAMETRPAAITALLICLAPFTLIYVSMFLSEVLYYPLILWAFYFIGRLLHERRARFFILAALFGALACLCKEAGKTIIISLLIIGLIDIINARSDPSQMRMLIRRYALAGGVFALIYGGWLVYEQECVNFGSRAGLSYKTYLNWETLGTRLAWFGNLGFYSLCASMTCLPLFTLLWAVSHPRRFFSDRFNQFSVVCLFIAGLIVCVFIETSLGGQVFGAEYTWNRYLSVYSILLLLPALKNRHQFDALYFKWTCFVLLLFFWLNIPSKLRCHFADALLFFDAYSSPVKAIPSSCLNGVFAGIVLITAILMRFKKSWHRALLAAIILIVYTGANMLSSHYWRAFGYNIRFENTIGEFLISERNQDRNTPIYYDPDFIHLQGRINLHRILCYLPFLIQPQTHIDFKTLLQREHRRFYYLSTRKLKNANLLLSDRFGINVYSNQPPPLPLKIDLGAWQSDSYKLDGWSHNEKDAQNRLTYNWAVGGQASVSVPLPARASIRMTAQLISGWANQTITIFMDARRIGAWRPKPSWSWRKYTLLLPPRREQKRPCVIKFEFSKFQSVPNDPRPLAVLFESLTFSKTD